MGTLGCVLYPLFLDIGYVKFSQNPHNYIYIYIYIYTHTHIHIHINDYRSYMCDPLGLYISRVNNSTYLITSY